jgi:hypothetical protein
MDTPGVPVITQEEIATLLADLKPGSLHSVADLWARYVRQMDAAGRMIANRNALGRALSKYGALRHRRRKVVGGKNVETSYWIVPGAAPINDDEERAHTLIKTMGEGIHPVELIWSTYQAMAAEHGWRRIDDRATLMRRLTKLGRPSMIEKGRPCRYFS